MQQPLARQHELQSQSGKGRRLQRPTENDRYGVVWGKIMQSLRTPMGPTHVFTPIVWWAEDQEVETSTTHGPVVDLPLPLSMATSRRGLTDP